MVDVVHELRRIDRKRRRTRATDIARTVSILLAVLGYAVLCVTMFLMVTP